MGILFAWGNIEPGQIVNVFLGLRFPPFMVRTKVHTYKTIGVLCAKRKLPVRKKTFSHRAYHNRDKILNHLSQILPITGTKALGPLLHRVCPG